MNPYEYRQRCYKELLAVGASRRETGIIFAGMCTGSGKTYSTGEEIAELYHDGLDEDGFFFKKAPGTKYLVVVAPKKDNRDSIVSDIKNNLKSLGHSEDEINNFLLVIESYPDQLMTFIKGSKKEAIEAHPDCPVFSGNKEVQAGIKKLYARCVGSCKSIEHYGNSVKRERDFKILLDQEKKQLEEYEQQFRHALENAIKSREVDFDDPATRKMIEEIYPQSKLLSVPVACIVMTPQKFWRPLDTIQSLTANSQRVGLYTEEVAQQAIYYFDEFDSQYDDLLGVLIDSYITEEYIQLIGDLYKRIFFEMGKIDPLLTGNTKAWEARWHYYDKRLVYKTLPKRIRPDIDIFYKRVEKLQQEFSRLEEEIKDFYLKNNIGESFKTHESLDATNPKNKMYNRGCFGTDVAAGSVNNDVVTTPVAVRRDEDLHKNLILLSNDSNDPLLLPIFLEALRLVRKTIRLFQTIATDLFLYINPYGEKYEQLKNAINLLGFPHNGKNDSSLTNSWLNTINLIQDGFSSTSQFSSEFSEDNTIYNRGIDILRLVDSVGHDSFTNVFYEGVNILPELLMAKLAAKAPVFAISATAKAPTVCNWSYKYLDRCCHVINKNAVLINLSKELDKATEDYNRFVGNTYTTVPLVINTIDGTRLKDIRSGVEFINLLLEYGFDSDVANIIFEAFNQAGITFPLKLKTGKGKEADNDFSELLNKLDNLYELERILRIIWSSNDYLKNVVYKKHFAFVVLAAKNLDDNSKYHKALDETLTNLWVYYLGSDYGQTIFDFRLTESEKRDVVDKKSKAAKNLDRRLKHPFVFARADSWEDKQQDFAWRLEHGLPAMLITTYQNGGFAKNMQYKFKVNKMKWANLKYLEQGFKRTDKKVDIDYLYVDDITNCLVSCLSGTDEDISKARLRGVIQYNKLVDFGEVNKGTKLHLVGELFKSSQKKRVSGIKVLKSFRVEAARIFAQCVGRVGRCQYKFPEVKIAFSDGLLSTIDLSWLDAGKTTPELSAIKQFIEKGGTNSTGEFLLTSYENVAEQNNESFMREHKQRNARLFKAENELAFKEFDGLKNFLLKYGITIPEEVVDQEKSIASKLVEMPDIQDGYTYIRWGDFKATLIKIPKKGQSFESALEDLHQRVENNVIKNDEFKDKPGYYKRLGWENAHKGFVSIYDSNFEILMSNNTIKEHFEDCGYCTKLKSGKWFIPPYMYISVLRGTWGEEAGVALLNNFIPEGYSLSRGNYQNAERCGDYLLLDESGKSTDIWFDFKNYDLAAEVIKDYEAEHERFIKKTNSVNAKALFIVNIIDDSDYTAEPFTREAEDEAWIVPVTGLINTDGTLHTENVARLSGYIQDALED